MSPVLPVSMGLNPIAPIQIPNSPPQGLSNTPVNPGGAISDFGNMVGQLIDAVNTTQQQANASATQLATGQSNDLHTVMIDMEKAKVTFDLAVQVRNKAVDAYNSLIQTQM